MAVIQFTGGINSALRVQRWAKELWHVHQRDQFWYPFTSNDGTNIVHQKLDFTKEAGYQMTEGLFMPFVGEGVINDEILEGQEEAPDFFSQTWTISQIRNAGRYAGEETVQQTEANLPAEIRTGLGEWMANKRDKDIFTALATSPTKIYYVNDRAGTSTIVAGDLCTLQQFSRAKTYAMSVAYPRIPPLKISKVGKQTLYRYVALMHDHVAYDLQFNDPIYQQVAREVGVRGDQNWLILGALIDWGGMSFYQHESVPIATTWGVGGNVNGSESYLLGRQALIVGIGGYKMQGKNGYLKHVEKRFDYENQFGVAIGIIKGEAKAAYNSKDWAVIAIRSSRTSF
jgi:N4-gp56 family major capsid protein